LYVAAHATTVVLTNITVIYNIIWKLVRGDANPSLSDRSRWRSTPPRA